MILYCPFYKQKNEEKFATFIQALSFGRKNKKKNHLISKFSQRGFLNFQLLLKFFTSWVDEFLKEKEGKKGEEKWEGKKWWQNASFKPFKKFCK